METVFLNGLTPASFCVYFRSFQTNNTIFQQQINVKICPSSIRHWDSNPRPFEENCFYFAFFKKNVCAWNTFWAFFPYSICANLNATLSNWWCGNIAEYFTRSREAFRFMVRIPPMLQKQLVEILNFTEIIIYQMPPTFYYLYSTKGHFLH